MENNPTPLTRRGWTYLSVFILLAVVLIYFLLKLQHPQAPTAPNPAFATYISGYTGGVISRNHDIVIKLTRDPEKKIQAGDPLEKGIWSFSPAVKGKAYWKDARTLVFNPSEPMRSGTIYTSTLKLDRVLPVDSRKLRNFVFGFQVIPQSFEMQPAGLRASGTSGLSHYDYEGKIITADAAVNTQVEKMVTATLAGKSLPIQWSHGSGNNHTFLVKGLKRTNQSQTLQLQWSGGPIDVKLSGKKQIAIPATGQFKLLHAQVENGIRPMVHLFFSDPLDEGQSLAGLVRVDTLRDMTFTIQGNEVTVYPGEVSPGSKEIGVYQGIHNAGQQVFSRDTTFNLQFDDLKPAVRFVGQGNILPSTEGLVLPIEAVNLKTVQVRVIKIFQGQIGAFLQTNDLDGSEHLKQVGRPVLQKLIHLDNMGVDDLGKWNRFTLELSKLIDPDPGAIYQIALSFGKQDAVLPCVTAESTTGLKKIDDPREQVDDESFDNGDSQYFYDDFGQYYGEDYNWRERDNPCNSAYYSGRNNVVKRNILATDIGLMAKRGTDNSLLLIATDLKTARPLPGVSLKVFNYQLQQVATTSTDSKGMAQLKIPDKAFMVEAQHHHQWAYLKLTDGTSLSVSQFEVSGDRVQQGIKGFLYGERGVWRPGDSIYLSFILEDKHHELPDAHPVVFEFTNPRGMLVQRIVKTSSTQGFYSFATATDASAPTGNWTAQVKVGGATFTKTIKIETIKPNRLKIDLTFPGGKITPDEQSGKLHARWLSGATAANLKAQYEMILSRANTHFKGYEKYQFDDPAIDFRTVDRVVYEGALDASGNAVIQPGITLSGPVPASLNAFFQGKVYEPGGNFSVDYQSVPYFPYRRYIGIQIPEENNYGGMLDLDKNYRISVATVNTSGQPVDMDSLEVTIYKTQWRWWWEENNREGADFVHSKYYHQVKKQRLSTHGGKGSFSLQVPSPQWGRYYIRVADSASGYTTGAFVYFEWPAGESSNLTGMPGGATRLTFTAEKQEYAVGENIKLFIPGSGEGNDLISIENGSRVIKTYWMKEKKGTNEFTIPVTAEMTPNIYINVSQIQPHGQTVNDLPIRQYGIIGLKINNPTTRLQPEITMASTVKPNGPVRISVKEKSGKPMAYTVAVVDEGLLDLTNFKTPDPHQAFYAKEALGVTSWDVFDDVIGAYGARLERLLSIGGDGAVEEQPQSQNIRFKPVVKFMGPFFLPAGKSATHSFVLPNYVGEVRTMVIAGYQGAYGSTEKSVTVSQPLMLLSTLPRVAGPEEAISLPVNVFAMEKGVKDITVHVTTDAHFSVEGESTQRIHLDEPGNTLVSFRLKAGTQTGAGKIHVEATGGGFRATSDVDLSIRNPNASQTRVLSKALQPGESWTPDITLFGLKGTNGVQLEVAGIPPLNLGKRLPYLINYPFGCVEQTVSAAFPQLYLEGLISLTEGQKQSITAHVKTALHALHEFQHASGGFTYWPGSNYTDDWATSYAGHFMLEARKKGYDVLSGMVDRWVSFQTRRADLWKPQKQHQDELMQAYRLYTLALAGKPDWSAMNRMQGLQQISLQARWRLADAYVIAGKQEVANQLIAQAGTEIADYRTMAYTYGSATRDQAMILQTLTDLGQTDKGYPIARTLSHSLNEDRWMSTQETAFSLIALAGFFSHQAGTTGVNYQYQVNQGGAIPVKTSLPESQVDIPVSDGAPTVEIKNTAAGVLYANLIIEGTPAAGDEQAIQNQLQMQVSYKTQDGKPLDPAHLSQGTDIVAEVSLYNPGLNGDYHNMALTQIFPSGWEIRNTRLEGTSGVYQASVPDYQDIRDDRVYTYFDLAKGQVKVFRILLSATYAGKFYLPAVKCAAMYDNSIMAVKPGEWVEVDHE